MRRPRQEGGGLRTQGATFQTATSWVWRIFRLDFSVFDEIRSDSTATTAAVLTVLASSLLAGLGSWLWALQHDFPSIDGAEVLVKSTILGGLIQTGLWFLWVYLVDLVLVRGYGARISFTDLVRTMGFAFVPVSLSVLVAIPPLAIPIGVISFGMALLFTNIAIQQVSGSDVREATLANLTGFGAFAVVLGICANLAEVGTFGGLAPGIFFFSLDL